MNIGIYVTSVAPGSPSQARLQAEIFEGLRRRAVGRFRFIVLSHDAKLHDLWPGFEHQIIAADGPWARLGLDLRAALGRALGRLWSLTGASGGRTKARLERWSAREPKHYAQIRALDIRLLWSMNQHHLPSPVPFMRTIWEANHRIHSMFPEYSYSRYGFDGCEADMADSLARASYVITGTREGKRQLVQMLGVHEAKIRVIPFPTPAPSEAGVSDGASAGAKVDHPYILYPARFWPHKNHVVILEALRILRERHGRKIRCVFTGADEGNLAYVLGYAERLGVADLIDYRGRVDEAELAALYSGAAALVFASAVGPDNLPPLEAMALGCPVITADVPGASEQYGDAALRFPPTDEKALANQILTVLDDAPTRESLIGRGRAQAARYTPEAYAGAVLAILDEFALVARAWERCDSQFT